VPARTISNCSRAETGSQPGLISASAAVLLALIGVPVVWGLVLFG
jgi:hypothetical protein